MKKLFFIIASCFFILAMIFTSCSEHGNVVIVNGISDLNAQKIACVDGSGAEEFVKENIVKPEIHLFKTNEEALENLTSANVAVAILERDFVAALLVGKDGAENFAVPDIKLADENLVVVTRAFDNKILEFWKLHDAVGADF